MSNKFFSENCAVYEIHVEKCGEAREAKDNMAHAPFMPDK